MKICYYATIAIVFFFVSCDKIQEISMDDSGGEPVAVNPQASLFYSNLSEIIKTPVSNPSLLATWAEKYKDKAYVKWYEFLTAKWAAPTRFTCTTLVWWCTKKAYGERISPWYSTLVTPSDVLCDNNTYLKVTIE